MSKDAPFITVEQWSRLRSDADYKIRHGLASLQMVGKGDRAEYMMRGPAGAQRLLAAVTNRDRLNVRWNRFVTDPRNARAEQEALRMSRKNA